MNVGVMMFATVLYLVVSAFAVDAQNEALGRCYADSINESYPVMGHHPDGSPNTDPAAATYFYTAPQLMLNGDYAFRVDEFVQSCEGQTYNVTISTNEQELTEEDFPIPCSWQHPEYCAPCDPEVTDCG